MQTGLLWIDTHVHVSAHGADGQQRDNLLQDLLAVLDAEEADLRWVISPDGLEMSWVGRDGRGITQAADFIHDLCSRAPSRLYGSCMVNPNFPEASLDAMDRCFGQWGFVQLGEFLQYMFEFAMDSSATEMLVRRAVELQVPVQVHISTSNASTHPSSHGMSQLDDLCRLADRVPEAHYILAHLVGMPDDDPPVVDAYLETVQRRYGRWPDNFWAEIRDFNSPGLRSALQCIPANRLLAGTDWTSRIGPPFVPYGTIFGTPPEADESYVPKVASMVRCLRHAGATDDEINAIGSGNAMRLLSLTI